MPPIVAAPRSYRLYSLTKRRIGGAHRFGEAIAVAAPACEDQFTAGCDLQRTDAMYLDRLDGRIYAALFDRKSAEWRTEQARLLRDVATRHAANLT